MKNFVKIASWKFILTSVVGQFLTWIVCYGNSWQTYYAFCRSRRTRLLEDEFIFSDAYAVAVLEDAWGGLFKLLSIDEGTIGTAFVAQQKLTIIVANGGMTTRGQFVFGEQDIAIWRTANSNLRLLQQVFLDDLAAFSTRD